MMHVLLLNVLSQGQQADKTFGGQPRWERCHPDGKKKYDNDVDEQDDDDDGDDDEYLLPPNRVDLLFCRLVTSR